MDSHQMQCKIPVSLGIANFLFLPASSQIEAASALGLGIDMQSPYKRCLSEVKTCAATFRMKNTRDDVLVSVSLGRRCCSRIV